MDVSRRYLNPDWFKANNSNYELVGVINRLDKMTFNPNACGELRFIYRLAYATPKIQSRLPLTINLVFTQAKEKDINCRDVLNRWRAPLDLSSQNIIQWLMTTGPLAPNLISADKRFALETNFQAIRSATAIRNLLGGNAEYILRVYKFTSAGLTRGYLENTIDYKKINESLVLKSELLTFLKTPINFDRLDSGILNIPEKFLTQKISSFAPHGIARLENRLFDRVFSEKDFEDMNYQNRKYVLSANAVLRRLNDSSCIGCHQNRTIAGFHFLGLDRQGSHPQNSILFEGSGHFKSEIFRRSKYLNEIANNQIPKTDQPFSIAPSGLKAQYGDFCGLKNSKGFSNWVCDSGLECQLLEGAVGEKDLGKCFPTTRLAGDPCLQNYVIQNHHSLDKMVQPWKELSCANGYTCQLPGGGFPGGMCTSQCSQITNKNREICGVIAGNGFSACLETGIKTFGECIDATKETRSRGLCNNQLSCRNDYVCAKVSETEGACLPSYFLFQIRVDGHPKPVIR